MLTVEQIQQRLADANLKRVAENAKVHPASLYRLMNNESEPMYATVKALSDYLLSQAEIHG
jgi:DNA-binding phage protein